MSAGTMRRLAGVAMLALAVWGCGGAASPAPAAASVSTLPSATVTPSVAPSAAPPSAAPSAVLPSFQLPSEAKDLEALLPATVCGATATKISQSGDTFAKTADEDFLKVLQTLGKSPADVGFALAIGGSSGCAAGIFRIKGVDTGALQSAFTSAAQQSGDAFTDKSLGGKDVKVQTLTAGMNYIYFRGDAILFVTAKSDDQAASVLQQMP